MFGLKTEQLDAPLTCHQPPHGNLSVKHESHKNLLLALVPTIVVLLLFGLGFLACY
jgi:hypothetical protein